MDTHFIHHLPAGTVLLIALAFSFEFKPQTTCTNRYKQTKKNFYLWIKGKNNAG